MWASGPDRPSFHIPSAPLVGWGAWAKSGFLLLKEINDGQTAYQARGLAEHAGDE